MRITAIAGPATRGAQIRRQVLRAAVRYLPHAGDEAARVRAVLERLSSELVPAEPGLHPKLEEELAAARDVLEGKPIAGPGPLRTKP